MAGLAFLDGCEDGPPVPLQVIYGSEDVILPYDGGLGDVIRQMFGAEPVVEGTSVEEQQSAIDSIPFPPVGESMANWAERDVRPRAIRGGGLRGGDAERGAAVTPPPSCASTWSTAADTPGRAARS